MPECVGCQTEVKSTNCIVHEGKLSFDYENFPDLLEKLDQKSESIKEILTKSIDKMWIKENHEYVIENIQDIIVEIDRIRKILENTIKPQDIKFAIDSKYTNGEMSLLRILSIVLKKLEVLESGTNNSSIYLP